MSVRRFVLGLLVTALSFCGGLAAAWADAPKQITLDQLKTIITNLGYDLDAGQNLQISVDNGKYKYPISFFLASDNTVVGTYIILSTIPPDKLVAAPACKLLYFNDTHSSAFSFNDKGKDRRIVLNFNTLAADVTPASMRTLITNLTADANGSDKIWNPELWDGSVFPQNCSQ